MLEREVELSELHSALELVQEGAGKLVVLEGAAGAGKSALVAEAFHTAPAGIRVLRARGSELEREFAFGAIRRLLEPVLAAASPEDRALALAGAAAPAAWVLSTGAADPDHAEAGFAVMHGIYWLISNLAAEAPLALVVDDLHWVDAASLRALTYLAGRVGDLRVMLAGALRTGEPGTPHAALDELRQVPGATVLRLGALPRDAVASMVRARLPEADAELCDACHEMSAGNPLYVTELLRDLAVSGDHSVAAVRQAAIPSLGDRLTTRLGRVGPEAVGLARAMAVAGDGAKLSHAASLANLPESSAAEIAVVLRRIEVLASDDPIAFVHPLVRRSIYDQLSVTERDRLHAQMASLLDADGAPLEASAAHVAATRAQCSEATVATLIATAREALGRAAPDEAISWLERALAEGASHPPRAELLAELGYAGVANRHPATISRLEEAMELSDNPALRARASVVLTELLAYSGQWARAGEWLERAGVECAGIPEMAVELALLQAGLITFDSTREHLWTEARQRFLELAHGESWAARALMAIVAVSDAVRGGLPQEVVDFSERALEDGRLVAERGAGGWAAAWVLTALVAVEEHERALALCGQLEVAAQECGSLLGTVNAKSARAWIAGRQGDLVASEPAGRTALEMAIQGGMPLMVATVLHMLGDAIAERPSLDDLATLVESIQLEPEFLNTWSGETLIGLRGRLRLLSGDRAGALADRRQVAEVAQAFDHGPGALAWRSELALVLPPGERDQALELVAEELRLARSLSLRRAAGIALRAQGILLGGDDGIETLRASVAALEGTDARYELALSLVELGAASRRARSRQDARATLESGMDLAHRCGATRLVGRAQEELRAAGARPRRPTRTGVEALTPSELRVARLAAAGRTNTDIAQELYVSLKTIETHLSHAYSKLGISGPGARQALGSLLEGTAVGR